MTEVPPCASKHGPKARTIGRDPAGEPLPDGDRDALLDVVLQALRGAQLEHAALLVQQQDRGGICLEHL